MASEMIEIVAKRVFGEDKWEIFPNNRDFCLEVARNAVEAMRDYTEAMSLAGAAVPKEQFTNSKITVGQSIAERCYLAMIDEALK